MMGAREYLEALLQRAAWCRLRGDAAGAAMIDDEVMSILAKDLRLGLEELDAERNGKR